ncbi:MAG TPA: LytTR family DNA-binding domain-containing protein [Puia sp.]|jgi:DNA-binding LytR/AlgR family response regulator|nr:LytTR family DNA-binding domain-containing protein [Puia sp.]
MRVIIIEDEIPAATRLTRMLQGIDGEIEIVRKLDSVEASVKYLEVSERPDLIFMDIQLADGLSFSIFEQVQLNTPVIFTTAFDHYMLKAFKVNSLDYLLKPIDEKELSQAVLKYKELYTSAGGLGFAEKIGRLMQEMNPAKYKERLLIKRGQQLHSIKTADIAFCYADGKLCFATDFSGSSYLLDHTLHQLESCLEPRRFFRVNRQLLVNIDCIKKVHTWLGGRLKVELAPVTAVDTVVSRERVNGFKEWLGN